MKNILQITIIIFLIQATLITASYKDEIKDFTVVKVRDGANSLQKRDTFVINIANVPDVFGNNIVVRIRGIDTPELNDSREEIRKISIQAKEELEKLFNSGDASQRDAIGDSRQKPKVILILYKLQKRTDNFIIQLRILFFKRKYFEV